ncbi:MAG: hypothetical protein IKP88_15300 [Lachnospiraceae bacterium]|nr:hypothetical protein [Lachnospiraceae bacterium]
METKDMIYTQKRTISSAYVDWSVKLGIAQAQLMVQDSMTECFGKMKCDDVSLIKLGYFWVLTKSKIKVFKRPGWNDTVETSSFPAKNSGIRTYVNTVFKDMKGELLLTANQELCLLDVEKHRPAPISKVPYPTENFPDAVISDNFEKIMFPDSDYTVIYEQVIRPSNLDMLHHLNNIEYVKFALNVFSEKFLLEHEIDEIEVHYKAESKENQTLKIMRKDIGNTVYIRIKESERCVSDLKICFA